MPIDTSRISDDQARLWREAEERQRMTAARATERKEHPGSREHE